jgi:threonine synthase
MIYTSTRGGNERLSSSEAIKQGIASDGGLFMPETIPQFDEKSFEALRDMNYPERAAFILSRFLDDYTYDELFDECTAAYSAENFKGGAAPVRTLNKKLHMLELWHGPTCAFKDMALQIMPRLLSLALYKTGEPRDVCILVATSGDTGKAALEGYRDADRVKIMVFYPAEGVSTIQKLQMATQEGNNVRVCSVKGNFDDTQTNIKKIFSDKKIADSLSKNGYFLSSANSINWGRLAPQIVYYISAYCDLLKNGTIDSGDKINICVPTGNFGNIFAAYLAKRAGLPTGKLICASNRNNILTDFLNTGIYNRNRRFYTTMSPSMDILISSNLERMLYLTAGPRRTAKYMTQLSDEGFYEIENDVKSEFDNIFRGYFSGEEETSSMIKDTYNEYNYLIDTHTAVALHCACKYLSDTGDTRHMLVVSTASPYKFASDVYRSVAGKRYENEFDNIKALNNLTGTEIPAPLSGIENKKIRFDPDSAIDADEMKNELFRFLG